VLAVHHPNPRVAGHAAGWRQAALSALRIEQASSCVVNAVVPVTLPNGHVVQTVVGAVLRDKHPIRLKQRPRPFFGIASGLLYGDAPYEALLRMLDDAPGVRTLLVDTDSVSGDPAQSSRFICAPLSPGPRANASLQALLQLPPISLSAEEAAVFKGHAAKRFLFHFGKARALYSAAEANDVGRFMGSVAQEDHLEPAAALLQRHSARCAVLPDIYSGQEKVHSVLALYARAHQELVRVVRAAEASGDLDRLDSFEAVRALQYRDTTGPAPLLLLPPPTE
jgi:hypothetical protein